MGLTTSLHAQTQRDLKKEEAILAQLQGTAPELVDTFTEATTRMDRQDYATAATLYQLIVNDAPTFDPAIRRLGLCLTLSGDPEHGLQYAEQAVTVNRSPENLSTLARLLAFPDSGNVPTQQVQERAFSLALEAQNRGPNRDLDDTVLVGLLAMNLNRETEFRDVADWMKREHPETMQSHFFGAYLAALDKQWTRAEEEIRRAGELGLDPKEVEQFLDSGVHAQATAWRFAGYSLYPVAVWILGLLALFVSGRILSKRVLESVAAGPSAANDSQPGLRRTYRHLINLAGLYYYVSLPIVVFLVIAVTASVIYGFYMMDWLPMQLIVTLVVVAIATIYYMIKSLFVKLRIEDPGRVLTRDEAPGLWKLTEEVANDIGTRQVDEIRVTPGTDVAVYERGSRKERSQDKAQRVLILGVGVLDGFRVNAFRAVLGHEYGHFTNRDTAGGDIALRVNRDMMNLANTMILAGQNSHLNLAFQFLRIYHFLFRRISHGASRLQEILADRVAAMRYGADAIEEGLRHVIRRGTEFAYVADQEAQAALETGAALKNIYDVTPKDASPVEERIQKILAGPTTDDDTHPCPNDRFLLARQVISRRPASSSGMVWDLFANREALTGEMHQLIENSLRPAPAAPRVVPEKTGRFHRCVECSRKILFGGYVDGAARYCSTTCYTAGPVPGFCNVCTAETTDESPGSTTSVNGIGTSLRPRGDRCRNCHSVRTRKWFVILFIPVIPLKEYRVRWLDSQRYLGRKTSIG
jgi:Zn-dependent protease with chaperone function